MFINPDFYDGFKEITKENDIITKEAIKQISKKSEDIEEIVIEIIRPDPQHKIFIKKQII